MQPAFSKYQLEMRTPAIVQAADAFCRRLEGVANDSVAIDIVPALRRVALDVLGRTLLGIDLGNEAETFAKPFKIILHETMAFASAYVRVPSSVPTPRNLRFNRAVAQLDTALLRLIGERRASSQEGTTNLLELLLRARDEQGALSDRELRNELLTLVFAGHDTTAIAMAWTLYLLGHNQDALAQLEHEVDTALAGRLPTAADLPKLSYCRTVIQESMRLRPPVWIVPRKSIAAAEFDGHLLPARVSTIASPYVTHRHPEFWPDPERFDPGRFAPGPISDARPRYAYFPFGGGPHVCIGAGLAMLEAQIVLATIVQQFNISLLSDAPVGHKALISLVPAAPIPMRFRVRSKR